MKNERRHELQTNILADSLGKWVEKVRPHTKTIAIGVLALVAAGVTYGVISWGSRKKNAAAWQSYMTAARNSDIEGFENTVTAYGNSKAGMWARLARTNIELSDAATEVGKDPGNASTQLEKVISEYGALAEAAEGNEPMVYERAQYGAAVANEYMASVITKGRRGHVKRAMTIYKELEKDGSKAIAEAAKNNLRLLQKYASTDDALEVELEDIADEEKRAEVRTAFEATSPTEAQKKLLESYPRINKLTSDWDEKDPNFGRSTYLAWLAAENYKTPLGNPMGSGLGGEGGFQPRGGGGLQGRSGGLPGSGLPGSGLPGSGLPGSGLPGGGLEGGGGSNPNGLSPGERLLQDVGKGIDLKKSDPPTKREPPNKEDQFPLDKNKSKKAPTKGKGDAFPIEKNNFPLKKEGAKSTPPANKGGLNPPANTEKKASPGKSAGNKAVPEKTPAKKVSPAKATEPKK